MKIYLCQHGECVAQEIDPNRPLTKQAKANVERMAQWLQQRKIMPKKIFHSGKLRAQQTAEILANCLLTNKKIEILKNLNPLDDVKVIADLINNDFIDHTMLVGHLPFMAKLISFLLIKKEEQPIIAFTPGTIVCLEKNEYDFWRVDWELKAEFFDEIFVA